MRRKLQRVTEVKQSDYQYSDIQAIYDKAEKVKRRDYPCLLANEENNRYPKGAKMYYKWAYQFDEWLGCKWCPRKFKKPCGLDYTPPQKRRVLSRV